MRGETPEEVATKENIGFAIASHTLEVFTHQAAEYLGKATVDQVEKFKELAKKLIEITAVKKVLCEVFTAEYNTYYRKIGVAKNDPDKSACRANEIATEAAKSADLVAGYIADYAITHLTKVIDPAPAQPPEGIFDQIAIILSAVLDGNFDDALKAAALKQRVINVVVARAIVEVDLDDAIDGAINSLWDAKIQPTIEPSPLAKEIIEQVKSALTKSLSGISPAHPAIPAAASALITEYGKSTSNAMKDIQEKISELATRKESKLPQDSPSAIPAISGTSSGSPLIKLRRTSRGFD